MHGHKDFWQRTGSVLMDGTIISARADCSQSKAQWRWLPAGAVVHPAREHRFDRHHCWMRRTILRNYFTSLAQSSLPQKMFPFLFGCPCVVHTTNLGSKYKELLSLLFSPHPRCVFNCCTTLFPLIKLLGAVIWCVSSLSSVLGLTRKPFSRGLVCFTFLFPHYLYLQLLLLFLS